LSGVAQQLSGAFSPVRLSSKSIVEFNKDRRAPIRVLFDLVHSRKRGSRATTLLLAPDSFFRGVTTPFPD